MLLAIETATIEVALALHSTEGLVARAGVRQGRRHVETLHPLIDALAAGAQVPLASLEAVAVDVGPGRFTGLRVGIAAAKALAFALSIPVITARSTEVLLHALADDERPALAIVDLRRGEIAVAAARLPAALLREGGLGPEPVLTTPERLAPLLGQVEGPLLVAGDGAVRYESLFRRAGAQVRVCGEELAAPPVEQLAKLAWAQSAGGRTSEPAAVTACYLRDADARINWSTREELAGAGAPKER